MFVCLVFMLVLSADGCFAGDGQEFCQSPQNLVMQYENQNLSSVAVGFSMSNVSFKHVTTSQCSYTKNWNLTLLDDSVYTTFITYLPPAGVLSCDFDDNGSSLANYGYEMQCSNAMGTDIATLYIQKQLNPTAGDKCVFIRVQNTCSTNGSVWVSVKYCIELTEKGRKFLKIDCPKNAAFTSMSRYTCSNKSSLIVNNDFSSTHLFYDRKCQFNATWNGTDNVICSFAPDASIVIKNTTGKNYFLETDNITMNCNVTDPGVPSATSVCYTIHEEAGSRPAVPECKDETNKPLVIQLNHTLNKAKITCQAVNNYTEYINNTSGISQPVVLNVTFAPISNGKYYANVVVFNNSATLDFSFSANPPIYEDNLFLSFSGNGTAANMSLNVSDGRLITNSAQTYTYIISPVTPANYGLYFLEIASSFKEFASLVLIRNLTGEIIEMTTFKTDIFISSLKTTGTPDVTETQPIEVYIIVIPVVAVLLIALVVVGYLLYKRRGKQVSTGIKKQKENPHYKASSVDGTIDKEERINPIYGSSVDAVKESNKEERVNPLYGITASASPSKTKKNEKEERKNPLYMSSSNGNDVSEVTYTEIEKNKKQKGSENPVFTVETTADTYAEVKKPKKEKADITKPDATYAEVQKVKGSKNDANLHGSENDPA